MSNRRYTYNYYGQNNKGTAAAAARNKQPKTYTAKCFVNQKAVDELVTVRERAGSTSNFSFTVKRAIESVVAYPEPITSYQQALTLKFVGPTLAKYIVPKEARNNKNAASATAAGSSSSSSSTQSRRKRKAAPEPSLSQGSSTSTTASSAVTVTTASATTATNTVTTTTSAATTAARRRQRLTPPNNNSNNDLSSSSAAAAAATTKTAKQVAYDKAVACAEHWKTLPQQLTWKVVLLIDGREQQSDHMQAKCLQSGIPTEERHLPIGDMAWMAQGYSTQGKQQQQQPQVQVELMLGTIMERKTTADLKASLFGTRYAEQRLRLQQTGLPQVLFLIEGDVNADLFKCPADTLHSAMWETRLHLGFRVVQTAHMDDTVRTLKRMHRRILQRTFPQAFQTEVLPTFAEAGVGQGFGRQQRQRDESLSPAARAVAASGHRRRRRRRRIESLVELSFDTDPTPMSGMARFMTYQELKAKVEMDRHEGTRSVGKLHLAMLKQVSTVSSKKCHAVARQYPTASLLLQAYDDVHDDADDNSNNDAATTTTTTTTTTTITKKRTLLANLVTADPNATTATSARDLKIGPRSAEELYVAYGFADPEDEAMRASRTSIYGGGGGGGKNDNCNYNKVNDTVAACLPNEHQQRSNLSVLEEVNEEDVTNAAVRLDTRKPAPIAQSQEKNVICLDDDSDDDSHHSYETKENASNTKATTPSAAAALSGNAAATTTSSSRKSSSVQKRFLDISWDTSMDITPSRFPSTNVARLPSCDSDNDRVLLDLSQNDDDDNDDKVNVESSSNNHKSQSMRSAALKKDTLKDFPSLSSPSREHPSMAESRAVFMMDDGSDNEGDDYYNSGTHREQEKSQEVEIIELD